MVITDKLIVYYYPKEVNTWFFLTPIFLTEVDFAPNVHESLSILFILSFGPFQVISRYLFSLVNISKIVIIIN